MHIQARARVQRSSFAPHPVATDTAPLTLAQILALLADKGFSLRGASGHDIEAGGEFAFRVRPRTAPHGDDADDDEAVLAAIALLREHHVEVDEVHVYHRDLNDQPGALRRFVEYVTKKQEPIIEISVATPNPNGTVPVQIYTGRSIPDAND